MWWYFAVIEYFPPDRYRAVYYRWRVCGMGPYS